MYPDSLQNLQLLIQFYTFLPVYKQLVLGWHSLSNNENYKLKESGECKVAVKPTIHQNSTVSKLLMGKFQNH